MSFCSSRTSNIPSRKLGLVGRNIEYSLSPHIFNKFFTEFEGEESYSYELWQIHSETAVIEWLKYRNFHGCNVTIPYKKLVAQHCDLLIGFAARIHAVNTIHNCDGKLLGYNTDVHGVIRSLRALVKKDHSDIRVAIFGTGGASSAVVAACRTLNWSAELVSRKADSGFTTYADLKHAKLISTFDILINTTPLGSQTHIDETPDINFDDLHQNQAVFDLVYNPRKTLLLKRAEKKGCRVMNGELMLTSQARLAWHIWNK